MGLNIPRFGRNCSTASALTGAPATTAPPAAPAPDPARHVVLESHEINGHLVMRVHYPGCTSYEGIKVLVFLRTARAVAATWKQIDPHFRNQLVQAREAPGPDARFPASAAGWEDAVHYALRKQ